VTAVHNELHKIYFSFLFFFFFLKIVFKLRLKQLHDDGMPPKFMCIVPRPQGKHITKKKKKKIVMWCVSVLVLKARI
jgi:hypothetical protein